MPIRLSRSLTIFLGLLLLGAPHARAAAPSDIALSASDVDDGLSIGTVVGVLSATDADDDHQSFSLVSGAGDADNASFALVDATVVDVSQNNLAHGYLWGDAVAFGQSFTPTRTGLLKAFAFTEYSGIPDGGTATLTIYEGDGAGGVALGDQTVAFTSSGSASFVIEDSIVVTGGQAYTAYFTDASWPSGLGGIGVQPGNPYAGGQAYNDFYGGARPDHDYKFTVSLDQWQLTTDEVFDATVRSSYSVRVRATDQDANTYDEAFAITVNHVTPDGTIGWDGGGVDNDVDTCANWIGDVCPGGGDVAYFDAFSVKNATLPAGTTSYGGLSIQTGYTGTITQAAGAELSLGADGYTQEDGTFSGGEDPMTIAGDATLTDGTFQATSGTTNFAGDITASADIDFQHNFGTTVFSGSSASLGFASSLTFYWVEISKDHGQTLAIGDGDTLVASNYLELDNGQVNGGQLEARGNVTVGTSYDGGNVTLSFEGAAAQTYGGPGASLHTGGFFVDKSGGTLTLAADVDFVTAGTNVEVYRGTFSTDGFDLGMTQSLIISGGVLQLQDSTVTVGANVFWSSGSIEPGTSTFVLNGLDQTLTGYMSFYNLTKTVSTAQTLTLYRGSTMSVEGTLTLRGASNASRLAIVSDLPGTAATFDVSGTSHVTDYLSVQDSTISSAQRCVDGCVNEGGNSGWIFSAGGGSSASSRTSVARTVSLVSPTGDDAVEPGDALTVRWDGSGGSIVDLSYRIDDGAWQELGGHQSQSGSYAWTVPALTCGMVLEVRAELTDLVTALATDSVSLEMACSESESQASGALMCPVSQATGDAVAMLVKLADDGDPSTQRDSTVYFVGDDGVRHAFPSQSVFDSWDGALPDLQIVGADALASWPLGENVTYRGGVRLVKVVSSPRVYAIAAGGILRYVESEELAEELYGESWAQWVSDVPDTFFFDYTLGPDISSIRPFSSADERSMASAPFADCATE